MHTCTHYIMIYNSSSQEGKPTNFHCYDSSVLPSVVYLGWLPPASSLHFYLMTLSSSKPYLTARILHRYALKEEYVLIQFLIEEKGNKDKSDWPCGKVPASVHLQPQTGTTIIPSLKTLCKNRRSLMGQKCRFIKKTRNT